MRDGDYWKQEGNCGLTHLERNKIRIKRKMIDREKNFSSKKK